MMATSATPDKDKIQTVVNEYLWRYKNTSRELPKDSIEIIIRDYSNDLKRGGFSVSWVREALRSATIGYSRMIKGELLGEGKINRPEHMGRTSRRHKKLLGKATWFQKAGKANEARTNVEKRKRQETVRKPVPAGGKQKPESVLFVPHTPRDN